MFEIHSSAQNNFDYKAEQIMDLLAEVPREPERGRKFNSDVHVAATITDNEIIGPLKEAVSDYKGNTVGRFFSFDKKRYGLVNLAHEELVELAEAIQRLPTFREKLSQNFVEESMFSWLEKKFTIKCTNKSFIEALIEEASAVVKPITVSVPLANTVVEVPFTFCGAVIKNIEKSMVDEMAESSQSIVNEENRKHSEKFIEDFRGKYQGYAVIELELECEPGYANEFSLSTASKITDLLGIYSGSVLIPDIKCVSRAKGTENIAQFTTICTGEEGSINITNGILDKASAKNWFISKLDLDYYGKCGLGIISEIVTKDKVTDFESMILNMALLYSKSAFTSDPLEKLVYMLSALEATLLRNENEPIQQNIAERMAFFISDELHDRKKIIKNLKKVYGLRSRYLHHGHSSTELGELSIFFFNVWLFYVKLVTNIRTFEDKNSLLNAIDDHKLS
jgi:hypothetical protein